MDGKKNRIGIWVLYYGLFWLININTDIAFEFNNSFEQFVGMLLSTLILTLLDGLVFFISYRLTGCLKDGNFIFSCQMQEYHWLIRMILALIVFVICSTPLFSKLISPLIPLIIEKYNEWLQQICKSITESITSSISIKLQKLFYRIV